MDENGNEEKISKDAHQMVPLLPPTYNHTVGLDCLRMVDTISVKQIPSLSEGKWFKEENCRLIVSVLLKWYVVFHRKRNSMYSMREKNGFFKH